MDCLVAAFTSGLPSIIISDLFGEIPSSNRNEFTEICALPDIDVPEKMPKATETKNKCFIRKMGCLHVSTT